MASIHLPTLYAFIFQASLFEQSVPKRPDGNRPFDRRTPYAFRDLQMKIVAGDLPKFLMVIGFLESYLGHCTIPSVLLTKN